MQDSIISLAMSFNLWLRCEANSGSGQCRSLMNDWRASNFQNRSSEVAQPLLKRGGLDKKLVSMYITACKKLLASSVLHSV